MSIAIYDHSSRFIVFMNLQVGGGVKGKNQSCFVLVNFVKATNIVLVETSDARTKARHLQSKSKESAKHPEFFAMENCHLKSCYIAVLVYREGKTPLNKKNSNGRKKNLYNSGCSSAMLSVII